MAVVRLSGGDLERLERRWLDGLVEMRRTPSVGDSPLAEVCVGREFMTSSRCHEAWVNKVWIYVDLD